MLTMNKTLNEFYLDYYNNYLTVSKFAEDNGISKECAMKLLEILKEERNKQINIK